MRNNERDERTLIMEQHMVIDGYHFSGSVIKAGRERSKEDGGKNEGKKLFSQVRKEGKSQGGMKGT